MTGPGPAVPAGRRLSRRWFLAALALGLGLPGAAAADAAWLEPTWLKVRRFRLASGRPRCRFVHVTDLHHKGNVAWMRQVVRAINAESPEFVLFTGDLVERSRYAEEALQLLGEVRAPVFGVPGNHDYGSSLSFATAHQALQRGGGGWLVDRVCPIRNGAVVLHGATGYMTWRHAPVPGACNILMVHYPAYVKELGQLRFDVMLAGHSHGGQVRLPFIGALTLPNRVGKYDWGLFRTDWGPLYVGSGIGYLHYHVRFMCRPEIAVFEV